jgi:hypothetical protein
VTRSRFGLAVAAAVFVLAATANSGGYRYGVSDQAFYATAVVKDLHPDFFPRDSGLLAVESHLMWADEIVAGLIRILHVDQPPLYLAIYVATLLLLFIGAVAFGRSAGMSWWAVAVLLLLLTFRHRIAKTGANSLEGYMHPRMFAFVLGVLALAFLLGRRERWALVTTIAAACWHPTTALWFGIVVGVGLIAPRFSRRRAPFLGLLLAGALTTSWAVWRGPLSGRLVIMDPQWLTVLSEKDYLFPHQWPLYAWLINLAYPLVLLAIYRRRRARGVLVAGEPAVVAGLLVLAAVFAVSLPLTVFRVALAVQLQVTRVFWVLDFAVAAYLAWWLADDWLRDRRMGRIVMTALLAVMSIGRGAFLLSQDRHLFSPSLPDTPWIEAMTWLKDRPEQWHVLADPGHAWKYGGSVRLAAEKDTLVESGKDSALAIYDRDIAMRVAERLAAVPDFNGISKEDLQQLASRFGLDVVVLPVGEDPGFPVLHRNDQFAIYRLR